MAAITLKPYQGLKRGDFHPFDESSCRNHTKTLLGIETLDFLLLANRFPLRRNHTKTLLGIETAASLALQKKTRGRNHTKTLLGIETDALKFGGAAPMAAITLKPYQGLKPIASRPIAKNWKPQSH